MSGEKEKEEKEESRESPSVGEKQSLDHSPEAQEEHMRKKTKSSEEEVCAVCFEEHSESAPLQAHHCSRCSADAWKICVLCHEGMLSRTCPVCGADYAPLVMHIVPGPPLKALADPDMGSEERAQLLYKFGIIRQVIGRSNVAVWSDKTKKMFFSLPQEIPTSSDKQDGLMYSIVSVALDESLVGEDKFEFTNSVWDAIENEVEHGEVHAGQEAELQQALNFILDVTKEDGHRLFTMMTPQDWEYAMNPSESQDTAEAFTVIRDSILQPLLDMFPKKTPKE